MQMNFKLSDKAKKIIYTAIGAVILCAALIACGTYAATRNNASDVSETNIATDTADTSETDEVTTAPHVDIIIEEDEIPDGADTEEGEEDTKKLTLSDLEIGDTSWAYHIVNRTNPIPENYEENIDFEGVWSNGRYYYFDARIADFAECMINDAERDGVTLLVCSAYRSYSHQTSNFNNQVIAYAKAKYSYANAYTLTSRYIAVPGTSEHQTGLAVDFITPGYMYLDDGFENTDAYKWLSENSYKYGFILRYPSDKSELTGINYEPWHFRFIGFEHAEDIYNSGLCLEEYMEAEGSVEFNPMAPLNIPAEPAWYDAYINPPEPEDTETETDSESSDETDSEDTVGDTDETDTDGTDSDSAGSDTDADSDESDTDTEFDSEETDSSAGGATDETEDTSDTDTDADTAVGEDTEKTDTAETDIGEEDTTDGEDTDVTQEDSEITDNDAESTDGTTDLVSEEDELSEVTDTDDITEETEEIEQDTEADESVGQDTETETDVETDADVGADTVSEEEE